MDESGVAIVIPALNESKTIANVIEGVKKFGFPIVVDDGSTDSTGKIAISCGAILIRHELCKGYDAALNAGFNCASKFSPRMIITLDGDGQHDPSILDNFIKSIDAGSDVVIGIRDKKQRFSEYLFGWYTAVRFGIQDPLCGFKAYAIDVYRGLGYFDSKNSIGTELLIYAAKSGLRVGQIRIRTKDREDDPRFGRMLSANWKILRAIISSL